MNGDLIFLLSFSYNFIFYSIYFYFLIKYLSWILYIVLLQFKHFIFLIMKQILIKMFITRGRFEHLNHWLLVEAYMVYVDYKCILCRAIKYIRNVESTFIFINKTSEKWSVIYIQIADKWCSPSNPHSEAPLTLPPPPPPPH